MKMYKTIQDTRTYLEILGEKTADIDRRQCEIFVIPSYTALEAACAIAQKNHITLGAQNMAWEEEGAYTGEISPLMLKEVGVELVEIGHSERRHVFSEDDIMENRKVHAALRNGLRPLLCVGENGEQKRYKINSEVIRTQIKVGLYGISSSQARSLMIAYEPVWAIGENGTPASKEYTNEMHGMIKEVLAELFGKDTAGEIPVLYGGSVNAENAPRFMEMPCVDGLFVGRSAWDGKKFAEMIYDVIATKSTHST